MKKVLITGSKGFIGKNLKLYLTQFKDIEVTCFDKNDDDSLLPEILKKVDFIFHLAGMADIVPSIENPILSLLP